jgi:glycosyltransferase involved in cell wall biosynthesis
MTKNILFCGNINEDVSKSWGKTNNHLLNELKKSSNIIGTIDYQINNKLLRKVHAIISNLFFGGSLIRDPFIDKLMELKFLFHFKLLKKKPDIIIHASSICIPKSIGKNFKNILYTDATIKGAMEFNNYVPPKKSYNLFISETNKYIERTERVFTFNEWTKNSLETDFKVNNSKITNIGFGANLNPYYGKKDYSNGLILIVLRKGLEVNKGLYLLRDAFRIAKQKNHNLKLAVVGTSLEPEEGIEYFGDCPREKTIELFQTASLYAMPSLFEPNGMVYIEALACKTPILGLNRLAFPEFCGHGKFGFIVEPDKDIIATELLKAFENPTDIEIKGRSGQEFVLNRYRWDIVTKKILEVA